MQALVNSFLEELTKGYKDIYNKVYSSLIPWEQEKKL